MGQQNPTPGQDDVLERVIDDLKKRSDIGVETYGTKLQTHNGRNALWDAYEEALDFCMYLKQALMEQEPPINWNPRNEVIMPDGRVITLCEKRGYHTWGKYDLEHETVVCRYCQETQPITSKENET